jgi:hypothetical protein
MDWLELENLEAVRIALILVGLIGAADLAFGSLSGSALAVPCALGAVGIHHYQVRKNNSPDESELRD